jgi:hypothetical protein
MPFGIHIQWGTWPPEVLPSVEDVIECRETRSEGDSEVDGGIGGGQRERGGRRQVLCKWKSVVVQVKTVWNLGQLTSRGKEIALPTSFPPPESLDQGSHGGIRKESVEDLTQHHYTAVKVSCYLKLRCAGEVAPLSSASPLIGRAFACYS